MFGRRTRIFHLGLAFAAGIGGAAHAAPSAALSVGAAREAVAIDPAMLPLDGFGFSYDPLQVRVMVLAQGDRRIALAAVDQTSLSQEVLGDMKKVVGAATGAPADNILIIATHTFSAPHWFGSGPPPPGLSTTAEERDRGQRYAASLEAALDRAAREATAALRPASMRVAMGSSDVNVNRNVETADGWWLGADDKGFSDKSLSIVSFEATDGRPIAILCNYAVQSAVMNQSRGATNMKGITSDLGGATAGFIERSYGGSATAFFLTGAAGDQVPRYVALRNDRDKEGHLHPVDLGDRGYPLVEVQAAHLGGDAVATAQAAKPVPLSPLPDIVQGSVTLDAQSRPTSLQSIRPTHSYAFQTSGKVEAPFWILRVGDVALVGVQAELSAATGAYIRAHSPFAHTLVVTMVNGAAKYMPEADAYRQITYEAMNSPFARGSAEAFSQQIVSTLNTLAQSGASASARSDHDTGEK